MLRACARRLSFLPPLTTYRRGALSLACCYNASPRSCAVSLLAAFSRILIARALAPDDDRRSSCLFSRFLPAPRSAHACVWRNGENNDNVISMVAKNGGSGNNGGNMAENNMTWPFGGIFSISVLECDGSSFSGY